MAKYKCVVMDNTRKHVTKYVEADNDQALLVKLKSENLYLISKEKTGSQEAQKKKLSIKDTIIFCRQLSIMLQSGITVIKGISILESKTENVKTRQIYTNIYEAIQKGHSLSAALREQEVFPEMVVNMVEAGEVSGTLEGNLTKMAEHYEKENKLNNKIKNAMLYPVILAIVATIVVIILVAFVLPTFFQMYNGQELPWPTQVVVSCSNFITSNWFICIIFVALLVVGIPSLLTIPSIRYEFDKMKLNLPIAGKLIRTIYSARCARTFASLYASGLDMIELLKMVSKVLGNTYVQDKFVTVIQKVSRGELISLSLQEMKIFDPMFTSMVYVGEESGAMDSILNKAADYFDEEADAATTRLVGLVEPLMIVTMGIIIGFIVISIMMPMYGMLETIQ